MADFLNALRHGLTAAEQALKAEREINDTLTELNVQLGTLTGGKLFVAVMDYAGPGLASNIERFFGSKGVKSLVLRHRQYPQLAGELAKWKQDDKGYPCTIVNASGSFACGDREALEKALTKVISNPIVGGKIKDFLAYSGPAPKRISVAVSSKRAGTTLSSRNVNASVKSKSAVGVGANSAAKEKATKATASKPASKTVVQKAAKGVAKKAAVKPITKKTSAVIPAAKSAAKKNAAR